MNLVQHTYTTPTDLTNFTANLRASKFSMQKNEFISKMYQIIKANNIPY